MDNITHTLVGLAAGELIHKTLPACKDESSNSFRRKLVLATSALASNFPDLDIVLTPLLPEPLGYLLHHRGHTHTIFYSFPQALALWGLIVLFWKNAKEALKKSATARMGFIASLIMGFSFHLGLDYLNSYGVHLFHPFDSSWSYGDMVFIVEPVFWTIFGVPLALNSNKKWVQMTGLGGLSFALFFFALKGFLAWESVGVLFLIGAALSAVQIKSGLNGELGLSLAVVSAIAFILLQSFGSQRAKAFLARELKRSNPKLVLLDIATSSFPANPLCWMFVSIESDPHKNAYHLRRGAASLLSGSDPAKDCPSKFLSNPTRGGKKQIAFFSHTTFDLKRLRVTAQNNCHFNFWLRFARMPAFKDGAAWDERFTRGPVEDNFTFIRLGISPEAECSRMVPKWGHPRQDLLKKD